MGIWFYFGAKQTLRSYSRHVVPSDDFVLIGLQHFVAIMFIIPAGIFAGANVTWSQFFFNMIPVFLGQCHGWCSICRCILSYAYRHLLKEDYCI